MSTGKKNITITDILVYKFYSLLGRVCRIAFLAFSRRKLSTDRMLSDMHLVLFTGKKGAKMMKAVLVSIYYRWEKIPRLIVISDGTPNEVLESALKFWPFPYTIKSWEECASYHLGKGRQSIVNFARINTYARKLLAILAESEVRPILYCDTDVIWFGDPKLPATAPEKDFIIRISTDNFHFYHLPVLRWLNRTDMLEAPPINSGVIYISGSAYDSYSGFESLMQFMQIFNEPFCEQTSFALLANRLGDTWTIDDILLKTTDSHWPLVPRYLFSGRQFARHHVATKHSWFWRDALFVVLFRKDRHLQKTAV